MGLKQFDCLLSWLAKTVGLSHEKGYIMEYIIPVLSVILGSIRVAIMWLDYKKCKNGKDTD